MDYDDQISWEEFQNAVRKLKNGKVADLDNIKAKLINNLEGEGLILFYRIIGACWNTTEERNRERPVGSWNGEVGKALARETYIGSK